MQYVSCYSRAAPTLTEARTQEGLTALHLAAQKGARDVAKLLVDKGADSNAKSSEGKNPVALAYDNNHMKLVFALFHSFKDDPQEEH